MANITSSQVSTDQEKFLVAKLLARSHLNLVMGSLCDKLQMKEGAGKTAYFVRYARMNVPTAALTEGVTPTESSFSLESVTVTLDQWGDFVEITDVAELTTSHPVLAQAQALLADNAARVMDREITVVMLAGTNVIYGDGSVTARSSVDASMIMSDGLLNDARAQLVNDGVPPFGGPEGDAKESSSSFPKGNGYILVCSAEVVNDISSPAVNYGTFVSYANFNDSSKLVTGEVGTWKNFRIIESNFLPRFERLGNTTAAASAGSDAGGITGLTTTIGTGSLGNATFGWKVTRKDLLRGFEESLSIVHTTATGGASKSIDFTLPSTAGYVYNIYFDKSSGNTANADMRLAFENAAAGTTKSVTAAATGAVPPDHINAAVSLVHPCFIVGQSALAWVGFYKPKFLLSKPGATTDDPLAQVRTAGFKYFGKAVIKDGDRLLRLEVVNS